MVLLLLVRALDEAAAALDDDELADLDLLAGRLDDAAALEAGTICLCAMAVVAIPFGS